MELCLTTQKSKQMMSKTQVHEEGAQRYHAMVRIKSKDTGQLVIANATNSAVLGFKA